jgi:hypothetical protein
MSIGRMNPFQSRKRPRRFASPGLELATALSVASQMALLCPPGFDEWVRQELLEDGRRANGSRRRDERQRP